MQLESQFALAKISNGKTKFHHTLAVLPEDIACNLNITTEMEYPALKEQVLESLKANKHHLIEQALSAVSLGDKRPTQLVTDIQRRFAVIGLKPEDDIVKSRLLSALPAHIRSALVGHDSATLDQYAKIADSMLAVAQPNNEYHVGALQHDNSNSGSNRSNNNNHRSNFSSHNNKDNNQTVNKTYSVRSFYPRQRPRVCNSHVFYGTRARHCRPWCQWPNKPRSVLRENEQTPRNSRPASPSNS